MKPTQKSEKQLCVRLEIDLVRRLKIAVINNGTSVQGAAREGIEMWLKAHGKRNESNVPGRENESQDCGVRG
jgi:hypothetical protein